MQAMRSPRMAAPVSRKDPPLVAALTAARQADAGLRSHGLLKSGVVADAVRDAQIGEPLLIQRIDCPSDFYYLVPYLKTGSIVAFVRVHAMKGGFIGAYALPHPIPSKVLDRTDARSEMEGILPYVFRRERYMDSPPDGYTQHPTLVWRPCREARSPYYPFHQFTVLDRAVYFGSDGRFYKKLHPLDER